MNGLGSEHHVLVNHVVVQVPGPAVLVGNEFTGVVGHDRFV